MCGLEYLKTVANNSIDLILTDPPYIISKNSGMNEHYNNTKFNEENNISEVKSEEEWEEYKKENNIENDENKDIKLKVDIILKYLIHSKHLPIHYFPINT